MTWPALMWGGPDWGLSSSQERRREEEVGREGVVGVGVVVGVAEPGHTPANPR